MHKTANIYQLYFLRFVKLLIIVILVLSVIGLSAAALSMLFGKPIGDDYGGIATFRSGNWLQEAYSSLTTAGRYGQSIAGSLLYGILRGKIVIILPLVVTAWFILLSFFYTKTFLRPHIKSQQSLNLYSIASTIILTFLVLFINNAPVNNNPTVWVSYQLFFWPSGIITYTLPLLIFLSGFYLLFLTSLRNRLTRRAQIIGYAVIVILSSLFNEVQPAIFFVVGVGLFSVSYLKFYKHIRRYRNIFLVTIAATGLGLVALFFSPGRIQRSQAINTTAPHPDGSLLESIGRNLTILFHNLYLRPRELLLLIVVGVLVATAIYQLVENKKKYMQYIHRIFPYAVALAIICIVSIVISITLIILGYGDFTGIYPRTMLIPQLTYVISIPFLLFTLTSLLLCRFGINNVFRLIVIFMSIAFLISIPRYTNKILTQVNSSVTYYNAWTEQDSILRKAASNNIKETLYLSNPATGIGDGFSLRCTGPYADSTKWLNAQITQYYGDQDRVCQTADKYADQLSNQEWAR